jgi:hypothetical protein
MKKLNLLFLPLFFALLSTQAQTINIGLHPTTCGGFEVVLKPSDNLSGTALTNVQFTIKWPDVVNLTNVVPNYPLAQQGETFSNGGYSYATFVGIDWQGITWSAGTEYPVLAFNHDQTGSGTGDFMIMPAGDPKATIQTVFYVEQWGLDVTGSIYAGATGVDLGKCALYITGSFEANDKIYDGLTDATFLANNLALNGVFAGDAVSLTGVEIHFATAGAGTDIPVYIAGASLSGADAVKYELFLTGTPSALADITPKAIAVTADPKSKIYGEADPELTYQFTPALIGSDGFTGALTREAGENVGTYAILQGTLALSNNYILDYTSAGFNITPKGLSVTADNKSKVFDGFPFTGFTVSYDGFVFGEDETSLGGTLIFTGNAVGATEVGTYTITPSGLTSTNYDIAFYDGELEITPVGRTLKVFLQGAYNPGTGEMNTGIISQLPTTQPYNVNPWFYNGIESVDPIPAGMVDWVLVDLRTGTEAGSLFERRAGILYNDGTAAVEFSTIESGVSYYVVVWHRNHMPVMSANAIELYEMTSAYDFTVLANCFGANPVILLEETVYGMIAGDVNSNGVLQYSGPGNDRGPVIAKIVAVSGANNINASVSNGYWDEDVNLDNTILYLGTGNDRAIIYQNLNSLVGPELNNVYTSEVPGAVISSKSTGAKEGTLDIALSGSNLVIQIELLSRAFLSDGLIDNVQFTLAWHAGDDEISEMLANYTSAFMLTPQGLPVGSNGIMYQVYASINLTALPAVFNPGDKISLITFANPTGLLTENRLWIADNEHTASQNGMYYVSVWGDDYTGEIVLWSLGMGENSPGSTIHIYPNPLKEGRLNIHFTAQENQMYDILIYDMFGQLVRQDKFDVSTSHAVVYSVDVSPLNPGVYLINVLGESTPFRDRFIIR